MGGNALSLAARHLDPGISEPIPYAMSAMKQPLVLGDVSYD